MAATPAALTAPPASARTETLFDGRSLNGWRHAGDAPLQLHGRTIRTGPGSGGLGLLYYARKRYPDFQLMLEFKAAEGANSGVHLRFPTPGGCSWIDCGYEVQINDTAADPRKTGSIYGFADLDAQHAAARPAGTWTRLRIRANGQTYTVYRDGSASTATSAAAAARATSGYTRTAALRTSSRSGPSGSARSEPPPTRSDRRTTARPRPVR